MPLLEGTYRFAPALGPDGNRVRRDGSTTDWWLIIQCDRDVGRYLRRLHTLDAPYHPPIAEPLWGAHVSVVRGETPTNLEHWRDREGGTVTLTYEHSPQEQDGYVYLPVECAAALDYRELLGLTRDPRWPLHLTIGNRKGR